MKLLATAALLLAATALAVTPPEPLIRPRQFRNDGAERMSRLGQSSYADFEAFQADGAGVGASCAGTAVRAATGESYVFARSGNVWCTADDYTLVSLGTDVPAIMRGRPGASLGSLVEPAGQNDLLNNRDGSNASWTKTTMTCTKTATGPDGIANSATTCTASAGNATVLQATVKASAANATSIYVKRRTGSGTVQVTRDNGATWNDITSSLSSTLWKRVVCRDTEGCMGGRCIVVPDMCATSANPTVGLRLVTNGDAVDFDLAQNEANTKNSSPITSAGVAGTRGAVTSSYFVLASAVAVPRTFSISTVTSVAVTNQYMGQLWQADTNFIAPYGASIVTDSFQDMGCGYYSGAFTSQGTNTGSPLGGSWNMSCDSNGTTKQTCTNGQCFPATATVIPDITNVTRVFVGTTNVGVSTNWSGVVADFCVSKGTACGQPKRVAPQGTHIVWLGDSITFGNVSAPTRPPFELYTAYARASSRMVMNAGVPGETVSDMKLRWDSYLSSAGWGTLVFLGGINDLRLGGTAAATYATAVQILNDAKARGMRVVVVGILPWKNYALWTAPKQTESDAYNALLSAWATANSQTYVTTDSLGTGSPLALQVGYDSGDGLHPNAAGTTALATLVAGGTP